MMDSVSLKYNIDQTRLFATGFSMGAFMANRLGCELNNRLAAIASVSGTIGTGIQCNPVRAIAAAHFHGTADPTVPYAGNQFCPGAEALVSYWMHHDHTDTVAASIDTFPNTVNDGKVVVHYKYLNGAYGTEVEFFKVIGGRHEWLSAANDINYSVEIWRFFRRFSWTVQANGIETPKQDLEIGVYPNPASDVVNIQLPTANTISDLSVTDMTGRTVYANHLAASGQLISINTAGFSRGIYMVGVNIAGQRISKKLIVE
jgi:polyhydroxybutyrate depolymerase